MKWFLVTEIRQTEKGEHFVVETKVLSKNMATLKNLLDNDRSDTIVDKNYRVKEIKVENHG